MRSLRRRQHPLLFESIQGSERGCSAQAGDGEGELKLVDLNDPFDIAQRTTSELDMTVPVCRPGETFRLHPRFDAAYLAQLRLGDGCGIPHLIGHVLEISQQTRGARDTVGAEQSLRFPGERPAPVVGAIGVDRPDNGAVLTFGTQIDIQVEGQFQVFGVRQDRPHDRLGSRLGCRAVERGGPVYVHDIRIRSEAELSPAVAAHPDDSELETLVIPMHQLEHAGEERRRHIGESSSQRDDVDETEDGGDRESEHLAAPGCAEGESSRFDAIVPGKRGAGLVEQSLA